MLAWAGIHAYNLLASFLPVPFISSQLPAFSQSLLGTFEPFGQLTASMKLSWLEAAALTAASVASAQVLIHIRMQFGLLKLTVLLTRMTSLSPRRTIRLLGPMAKVNGPNRTIAPLRLSLR